MFGHDPLLGCCFFLNELASAGRSVLPLACPRPQEPDEPASAPVVGVLLGSPLFLKPRLSSTCISAVCKVLGTHLRQPGEFALWEVAGFLHQVPELLLSERQRPLPWGSHPARPRCWV